MLSAVNSKRHGIRVNTAACLELPQTLDRYGVESEEVAFLRTAKDEAARGRQQACPGGRMELELPHELAGHDVQGADGAKGLIAGQCLFAAAQEGTPRLKLRFTLEVVGSHLADGHVEQLCPRAVGRTEPVGGSLEARRNERALFAGKGIGESDGVSLLVESLGPSLLGVGDAAQIL